MACELSRATSLYPSRFYSLCDRTLHRTTTVRPILYVFKQIVRLLILDRGKQAKKSLPSRHTDVGSEIKALTGERL